mmetsp:Transcript_3198/g.4798  ORF Transcript_3198/g.4798 Transcript_3198/m.4798 type:complete len:108 (-) Transcript_3198:334-657(-)
MNHATYETLASVGHGIFVIPIALKESHIPSHKMRLYLKSKEDFTHTTANTIMTNYASRFIPEPPQTYVTVAKSNFPANSARPFARHHRPNPSALLVLHTSSEISPLK